MSDRFRLVDGKWEEYIGTYELGDDGEEVVVEWESIRITNVPVKVLLNEWDNLVGELSDKEVELYNLKETYLIAEQKIINETDFKEIYGKNNEKVRTNHVKNELADMVSDMKSLEFGINWIRNYIPLLKEVIRSKKQ